MTVQHYLAALDEDCFASSTVRYAALEVASRADRKGVVRMTQAEFAEVLLLSLPTVKRCFKALEGTGTLRRMGHGRYQYTGVVNDVVTDKPPVHTVPAPTHSVAEAIAETARLKAVALPNQYVTMRRTPRGSWPVLVEKDDL